MPPAEQNWARNLTYSAKTLHRPTTIAEIQEIVRRASKIRAAWAHGTASIQLPIVAKKWFQLRNSIAS